MLSKKRILKKRVRSLSSVFFYVFLGALALVIIGFLTDANFRINKKRSQLETQINSLQAKLRELQNLKAEYEQGILRAETNEFWEEKLREQGYKKPGEGAFVVVPREEVEQEQVEREKTWWQKLLEKIGF